jgi:hypothetical protein
VSKLKITDLKEIDLQSLKHNENLIVMGMRIIEDGQTQKGSGTDKYSSLAENRRHHDKGLKIQIFSFNKALGIQDLRKGQSIFIKGKLNSYTSNSGKTFYSIYVEQLEEKQR